MRPTLCIATEAKLLFTFTYCKSSLLSVVLCILFVACLHNPSEEPCQKCQGAIIWLSEVNSTNIQSDTELDDPADQTSIATLPPSIPVTVKMTKRTKSTS